MGELETLYSHLREADRLAQSGDKQAEQDARKIYAEIQRLENLESTGQENVGIKTAPSQTPFGIEVAPYGGALGGASVGAAFAPQISKSYVTPAEEIIGRVAGKTPTSPVENYIRGSSDMDFAGGKDYGTAYKKAEIASGKPVESRGAKTPIRKGNLSIQNQPVPPTTLEDALVPVPKWEPPVNYWVNLLKKVMKANTVIWPVIYHRAFLL
jgi:hypothetical protein